MVRIAVIQGHPDPAGKRLCHALAKSYIDGAQSAGHEVDHFDVGRIKFPLLRTHEDWHKGIPGTPGSLKKAQKACMEADHLVFIYPLWFGTMPALLKGFLEQVFRPGVALDYGEGFPRPLLKGKSARIIITMGMPAFVYRWYFLAHSLKSLERNILKLAGIAPVRSTLFGMVERASDAKRRGWLDQMRSLGARAA